jgi:hypothetical protein
MVRELDPLEMWSLSPQRSLIPSVPKGRRVCFSGLTCCTSIRRHAMTVRAIGKAGALQVSARKRSTVMTIIRSRIVRLARGPRPGGPCELHRLLGRSHRHGASQSSARLTRGPRHLRAAGTHRHARSPTRVSDGRTASVQLHAFAHVAFETSCDMVSLA